MQQREIKLRAWNLIGKCWDYFTLQGLAIDKDISWREYENWCEYTNLKDRNGKKIYEGDIVKGKTVYNPKTNLNQDEVYWVDGKHGYYPFAYDGAIPKEVEVIGNIYENPGLFK